MEIKKGTDGCLLKLMSVRTENKCNSASVATLKSGKQQETLTCEPGAAAQCGCRTPKSALRGRQFTAVSRGDSAAWRKHAAEVGVVSSQTLHLSVSGVSERSRLARACHDSLATRAAY